WAAGGERVEVVERVGVPLLAPRHDPPADEQGGTEKAAPDAPAHLDSSQTSTVLSSLAEASRLPSGLKASAVTRPRWPSKTRAALPVVTSHTRTVHCPPAATSLPSGLKAICRKESSSTSAWCRSFPVTGSSRPTRPNASGRFRLSPPSLSLSSDRAMTLPFGETAADSTRSHELVHCFPAGFFSTLFFSRPQELVCFPVRTSH